MTAGRYGVSSGDDEHLPEWVMSYLQLWECTKDTLKDVLGGVVFVLFDLQINKNTTKHKIKRF